jgi:hypothetical protein
MGLSGDIRGAFIGIVKHRQTGDFYRGSGDWTADAESAMQFDSLSAVVEEARKYHIRDCCEFILTFTDRADFRVAIPL